MTDRPRRGREARLGIDRIEEIVRFEIERLADDPPPDSLGGLWRVLAGGPSPAGTRVQRWMFRLEDAARTVLHRVRKWRSR